MNRDLIRALFGAVLLLSATAGAAEPRKVWIDTDLSLGSPLREVDDAYALLLAFHSPELRIVGLSTTFGNAPLRATTERTADLVKRLGVKMPVHAGPAEAADALASVLQKEGSLTYIALGPLTNLANFLTLHPEMAGRVRQIILVAGESPGLRLGLGPGKIVRIHDANFVKDRAAMRLVLATPIPLLMVPIETAARLTMTAENLRALRKVGPAERYVAQKSATWLWFWTHLAGKQGGPIFDALAVVAAARPKLLTLENRSVAIDGEGELRASRPGKLPARSVLFCTGFAPETKAFVLRRLFGVR